MNAGVTVAALLGEAARALRAAGIAEARREARLLLEAAGGLPCASQIAHPERWLGAATAQRFQALTARRAAREPLSHILGQREFFSRSFLVSPAALDPRPDSESLIEAVLARLGERKAPYRLLDLGTGTGCLLLTLLAELPQATGLGVDKSGEALALARANGRRLGLDVRAFWRSGDWAAGLGGTFDVILSNPPYIPTAELAGLAPEVRDHEPHLALDGGADGLDRYRALIPQIPPLLAASGILALEIGDGQAASVEAVATAAGLRPASRHRDLAGRIRCLLFSPAREATAARDPADDKKGVGKRSENS